MPYVKFDDIVLEAQRMFFIDLFSGKFNAKSTFWQICNVVCDWGYTRGYNQAVDEFNKSTNIQ